MNMMYGMIDGMIWMSLVSVVMVFGFAYEPVPQTSFSTIAPPLATWGMLFFSTYSALSSFFAGCDPGSYVVYVLANKESGLVKTVGQVVAAIIALVALVMLFYGTIYGGMMGWGMSGYHRMEGNMMDKGQMMNNQMMNKKMQDQINNMMQQQMKK